MKVLIIIIIAGLFALFSTLIIDKGKGSESKRTQSGSYVCRHVYYNPNPTVNTEDTITGGQQRWSKGDCAVRAFCGVLDLPWEAVFSDLSSLGLECHDLPNSWEVVDRYAKEKGLVKRTLRRPMSISDFAATHDGVYIVTLKKHVVCVKNHRVYDTSDCGRSRMKTYYEKDGEASETYASAKKAHRRKPSAADKEMTEDGEKTPKVELAETTNRTYVYFNPNPDAELDTETGRAKAWRKGDCVIRAFCGVLGRPWKEVYLDLCSIGMTLHDMPDSRKVFTQYAKEKKLVKRTLPSAISLSDFATSHDGVYLVQMKMGIEPEVTCVMENKIHDILDYGQQRIRTYYEKVG